MLEWARSWFLGYMTELIWHLLHDMRIFCRKQGSHGWAFAVIFMSESTSE